MLKITGTFLDEISCDIPHQNWGRKEWERDFRAMKSIGIDTVIMIRCGWKRWMTYPSQVLARQESCHLPPTDLVEMFLDLAEANGMNFFFGTYDSGNYWYNRQYRREIDLNLTVAEEAWRRYGSRKAFKGWYRYVSGTKDHNGNVAFPPERPDSCSIYAVLYRSDDGSRLDGSNILTSDRVVAKAVFHSPAQTLDGQWKQFENNPGDGRIEFEYLVPVNDEDLAAYKYNLAVVFSSSRDGATFKGAIDSELLIDDVEIVVE